MVSNREPYSHEKTKKGIICKQSVGGVVTALDPLMQECKGLWIAWGSGNADFTVVDAENKVLVPEDPKYTLKRIKLSKEEIRNYYQGFSNRVLWPLFHMFVEKMQLKETYWNCYCKVNEKFAHEIINEITTNDFVWIHDYHLSLVPRFIKDKKPDAKIAFFWHIPWQPWEVFGTLPQRNELLKGLLHSDFIGFHTLSYVKNFMDCAVKKQGVKIDTRQRIIKTPYNETRIRHIPLGISYQDFANSTSSVKVTKKISKLKKFHKEKKLILGIDRLDYTKGILDRIAAYEYFLEQYPEFREKVVFIQVATPSRDNIEEYCSMKKEIDEAVGNINGRFGSEEWTPVLYFYRNIPQQSLIAYYNAADIGLLTPLRDGMNLIAKEFIATKSEEGVLILSEFAGASEELDGAIMVNPYDIKATADAIKSALEMPTKEKKQRFQAMKDKVKQYDSQWWLSNFLEEWEKMYA